MAMATESFLPSLDGVTTSVCRVAESLCEQGHTAMIIAPGPAPATCAVHVASPFLVGARGLHHAEDLDLPTVAIYQTDMPNDVLQHGRGALGRGSSTLTREWIRRIHSRADLTLAPGRPTLDELRAPNGEVVLGYVGRLAPEKELHRLAQLAHLPGTASPRPSPARRPRPMGVRARRVCGSAGVAARSWDAVTTQLVGHYGRALAARTV